MGYNFKSSTLNLFSRNLSAYNCNNLGCFRLVKNFEET